MHERIWLTGKDRLSFKSISDYKAMKVTKGITTAKSDIGSSFPYYLHMLYVSIADYERHN